MTDNQNTAVRWIRIPKSVLDELRFDLFPQLAKVEKVETDHLLGGIVNAESSIQNRSDEP